MRLAAAALLLLAGSAAAFAPSASVRPLQLSTALASTLEYEAIIGSGSAVSADDFNAKLAANREKMAAKDKTSKSLSKDVSISDSVWRCMQQHEMCFLTSQRGRLSGCCCRQHPSDGLDGLTLVPHDRLEGRQWRTLSTWCCERAYHHGRTKEHKMECSIDLGG